MRKAGLLLVGRDDPDVVGELPRNLLEQLDPVGLDAVVVDDEDAMIAELRRRFDIRHSPSPTHGRRVRLDRRPNCNDHNTIMYDNVSLRKERGR